MKKIGSLFFFSIVFSGALAFGGDLHFDATVDRNQITLDDNVTLRLTLSTDSNVNDEEEPRLPSLDGFELLNKWSQSSSSSAFVNGQFKFERKFVYNYSLTPQKKGNLVIGPAQIRVNGQTLQTKPITIAVADSGSGVPHSNVAKNKKQPPADEDQMGPFGDDDENDLFTQLLRRRGFGPPGQANRPPPSVTAPDVNTKDLFFISVETNKKKAYVGEEIVATWYLFTKGNLQGFDALKYPDLKGFWKEDLDMATRLNFHQEVVNGIPYSKALLVSYALYPLGPGKKVIDSYQAKGTVIQMDSPMAMFGLGAPINVTKSSKEIEIDVVPLPTEGRPASFSGAVGKFNVTGSLSATEVKANTPVSLKIRFSGQGNVKAIELPPLDLPKTMDLYDTKKESKLQKNGEGYKEFELLIVPRVEGMVTIPSIPVSYFDPKAEKYVSAQTPAFQLKVLPGDPMSPNNVTAQPSTAPEPVKAPAPDIQYLKTTAQFGLPPVEEKILWFIAFVTVYLSFGFQIWRVYSGRDGNSAAEIRKKVKKRLQAARALIKKQEWRAVGVEISNAVISTLGEVTGGGVAAPSEDLLKLLPDKEQKLKESIRKFLNRCEIVSFAPKEMAEQMGKSDGEGKKLVNEAEKIIADLLKIEFVEASPGALRHEVSST